MQVIAGRTLREFRARHPHADGPIRAWFAIAAKAQWANPAGIKRQFGATVDFVGDKLRLCLVQLSYRRKPVFPEADADYIAPAVAFGPPLIDGAI